MKNISESEMYNALINRDSSYDGLFIIAVKTTGIFCRPVCTAKKPKLENVEFFKNTSEAINNGYRPCKICNPMNVNNNYPDYVEKIIRLIESDSSEKITDFKLKQMNIDPYKIKRWFKKNHGITFHSFQRLYRINSAFGNIKNGVSVTQSAFESGYNSLSAFTGSFNKATAFLPKESNTKELITISRLSTPLGPMLAGVYNNKLCLFEFNDRRMLETQIKRITKIYNTVALPGSHKLFDKLQTELNEYFSGTRKDFSIPLDLKGTDFQEKVWNALLTIPYGNTRSYSQHAVIAGKPLAVRAVAKTNGDNRIAILVPCHRVIGKDGSLTGYGGGLWRKQWLLNLEKNNL